MDSDCEKEGSVTGKPMLVQARLESAGASNELETI